MTQWHMKSPRKISGGVRTTNRRSDKKLAWKGGAPTLTTIALSDDDIENITVEGQGNTTKTKLRLGKYAQIIEKGKAKKLEILSVIQNDADSQFARRNIITKGAIIRVRDGNAESYAKVTSRPGQDGQIHGIIVKDYVPLKEEKAKAKKEAKEGREGQGRRKITIFEK